MFIRLLNIYIWFSACVLVITAVPAIVFAYDDKTTHPALTKEISRFFNMNYPELALNSEEIQVLMKGSIDEDEETRWLNHFYDPVYNRGLVFLGNTWESSKDWSQDTLAQAEEDGAFRDITYGSIFSLFSSSSDYSWDRAVYEYAWKDKNRGLEALGHILHLLEDKTVPDHTRNDPHPPFLDFGSPYEYWTKRFSPENLNVLSGLDNQKPLILASLNDYFDKTANYSNNNFFSKDTILDKEYLQPIIIEKGYELLSDGQLYEFGYRNYNGEKYRLSLVGLRKLGSDEIVNSIDDPDDLILTDYWNLLSKQAVINGAGAVKLFFDEVEKEKQTRTLWYKNLSWWQKMLNWTTSVFSNVWSSTLTNFSAENLDGQAGSDSNISYTAGIVGSTDALTTESTPDDALGAASGVTAATNISTPSDANALIALGVSTDTTTLDDAKASAASGVYDSSTSSDAVVPAVLGVSTTTILTPDDAADAAASGVATTIATQPFIPPMIVGGGGDYISQVQISIPDDAATSTSDDSYASAASDVSTTTDTMPLDISLIIRECSDSFSKTGCVIATTTLTILLESNAEDLESFTLNCQFRSRMSQPWQNCEDFPMEFVATPGDATTTESSTSDDAGAAASDVDTTTATSTSDDAEASAASGVFASTIFLGSPNTFYGFKAKAKDKTGNESQEVIKSVEINPTPIIINEIAWAGTGNSATTSEQEWLELYNRSNSEIDLNGWQLKFFRPNVEEPKTIIELSGKIAPNDYFLIERDTNETIANLKADLVTSFGGGLADEGMILKLERGPTTMDRTPELCAINNPWTFGWCGGVLLSRVSMERIDYDSSGETQSNWGTYFQEDIININKNSEGNPVYGTPKERNNVNYLIAIDGNLTNNKILTKENSPYIIRRVGLNIREPSVLTIEPGVVVKIMTPNDYWAIINVYGKIFSQGTTEEPIVFTSIYDDEYAGDTNKDGLCEPTNASSTAICPQPGNWRQFTFNPESSGSEFTNTIIRYGGNMDNNLPFERRAMIYVTGADVPFRNSRFEYSINRGLTCINCNSTIEASVFYKNAIEALIIAGGSPKILNNTFLENGKGIFASDIHGGEVVNNAFDRNGSIIIAESAPPLFGGNTVTDDSPGVKGIILRNGVGGDYSFAKDLSYVIEWGNYVFGENISAEKGTVFKFMTNPGTGLTIAGAFRANGTPEEPVVFTSFYDDEYGGDTSNDATSSQPVLGHWSGINFLGQAEAVFDSAVIRYAGGENWWYDLAGIKAVGGEPLTIKNSVIEKNKFRGVWVAGNASTTITDTIFRDNKHPDQGGVSPYGLLITDNGTTTISNLIFRNNDIGIGTVSEYHIINNGEIDIDDSNITKTIPADLLP